MEKVSEEQGGFRKGKGCEYQISAMKRLVEEYLGKDKKLYAAFMYLKKAYDRVARRFPCQCPGRIILEVTERV